MTRLFKGIASFVVLVGSLLSSRVAGAQTALPLNWLSAQVNESGQHCAALAEQREGDQLLLACGAAGAWEISLAAATPKFVRSYGFSGDVVGFFKEPDGRLWVKLRVLEARPFANAAEPNAGAFPDVAPPPPAVAQPLPPSVAAAVPAPAPDTRERVGRVERVLPGEVIVTFGSSDGIKRSDHIEFALPEADTDEFGLTSEVLAVGVVTNVIAHNARVRIGLNESVPVGALAVPTVAMSTGSLSAPPRVSGLWELELMMRPFVAVGELGGGALFSGSIGYRYTHLHLQAVIDPVAFAAVENNGSVAAVNAAAIASYDSQYFELGLGLGFQSINETSQILQPGTGLTAVQAIRFGARDGLNLSARTNLALFHSEFQFGAIVVNSQVPLTRGYWLLLNGGGGNVGYGFGELGLRTLLAGNGLAGSKYLTITAGGVGVFKSGSCDENFSACGQDKSFGGPTLGVGGEWRF
ncbi:MAG TPA: hypothetical protein VER96_27245 [Polyangiaceae bacterium]|nr:hypothetical protein [Polyangiaceae bacterium]